MKFIAEIDVMPLKELLDPQGKAVTATMVNIGLPQISSVRIGKHITAEVNATDEKEAEKIVADACRRLLHNPVVETFSVTLRKA